MDYSKLTTDKYKCRECGKNKMYPNNCGNKIMGYECADCGAVNYPVLDVNDDDKMNKNGD